MIYWSLLNDPKMSLSGNNDKKILRKELIFNLKIIKCETFF